MTHSTCPRLVLVSIRKIEDRTELKKSAIYERIGRGVFPPRISLSSRCSRWLDHEIDAVIAAEIAGATPEQLRQLVRQLIKQRSSLMPSIGNPVAA